MSELNVWAVNGCLVVALRLIVLAGALTLLHCRPQADADWNDAEDGHVSG
ncbi:hypothetical protein ABID21_000019 [Pseudorhizobium tarimense]|uniref:Uncharacterized protein n=1 Tax=Pseudorhizobium tarimense TaxID=1079109 RepID=A0ABV2H0V3_9HYPH|nr:hypothetical protein [Pseudorhizobium tarimense]MCJ8517280.1 hypothetical protein [Pseudorhizobium tarimense]